MAKQPATTLQPASNATLQAAIAAPLDARGERLAPEAVRQPDRTLDTKGTEHERHLACDPVTAAGLRLNVGCGPDGPQSWTNIDRSPHILLDRIPSIKRALYRLGALGDTHMATWPSGITYGNVCRGLPYPDASAAAIYSSHMLEHLYFDDAQRALREFRRLLSPAGILRLALPDSERLAGDFVANCGAKGADAALEFNLGLNAYPLVRPSGLGRLTSRLGASMHRWQPTGPLVTRMLIDAGFDNVIEQDFLSGDLPDLASVEHRAESFFVEATVAKGTRHT